jgi:hypothetical protein
MFFALIKVSFERNAPIHKHDNIEKSVDIFRFLCASLLNLLVRSTLFLVCHSYFMKLEVE